MKVNITSVKLESDRLLLREFYETDLNDFNEYAKVDMVGEWAGWPHHKSIEESKTILTRFISCKQDFAIVYKQNNKVIGSFGLLEEELSEFSNLKQVGLGYTLSKDYWNMGLMSEACKRVIEFCFDELKVDLIWICHGEFNHRSKRVIEKSGFEFYKEGTNHNPFFKEYQKNYFYIIKK